LQKGKQREENKSVHPLNSAERAGRRRDRIEDGKHPILRRANGSLKKKNFKRGEGMKTNPGKKVRRNSEKI